MRPLRWLFSFHGRFSRADMWAHHFASGLLTAIPMIGLFFFVPNSWVDRVGFLPMFGSAIAVACVLPASAAVRRLHDFNLSGWWIALYPIVLAAFVLGWFHTFGLPEPYDIVSPILFGVYVLLIMAAFILLYLVPGQRRANRFGPVRKDRASPPEA